MSLLQTLSRSFTEILGRGGKKKVGYAAVVCLLSLPGHTGSIMTKLVTWPALCVQWRCWWPLAMMTGPYRDLVLLCGILKHYVSCVVYKYLNLTAFVRPPVRSAASVTPLSITVCLAFVGSRWAWSAGCPRGPHTVNLSDSGAQSLPTSLEAEEAITRRNEDALNILPISLVCVCLCFAVSHIPPAI